MKPIAPPSIRASGVDPGDNAITARAPGSSGSATLPESAPGPAVSTTTGCDASTDGAGNWPDRSPERPVDSAPVPRYADFFAPQVAVCGASFAACGAAA